MIVSQLLQHVHATKTRPHDNRIQKFPPSTAHIFHTSKFSFSQINNKHLFTIILLPSLAGYL